MTWHSSWNVRWWVLIIRWYGFLRASLIVRRCFHIIHVSIPQIPLTGLGGNLFSLLWLSEILVFSIEINFEGFHVGSRIWMVFFNRVLVVDELGRSEVRFLILRFVYYGLLGRNYWKRRNSTLGGSLWNFICCDTSAWIAVLCLID